MERPTYIVAAAPTEPAQLKAFFESGDDSVMALIDRPPVFRRAGWDLTSTIPAKIMNGEYLEVSSLDEKIVRLYEDGTLLVRVTADSFLAWPRTPSEFQEKPKLNTLGLVELTTMCVFLYSRLLGKFERRPDQVKFQVEFRNVKVAGGNLYVVPFPVLSWGWQHELEHCRYPISEKSKGDVIISTAQMDDPPLAACLLVEKVFQLFGVPSNELPYMTETTPRRVDVASFSAR